MNATQVRERASVLRRRIDDYEQRLLTELEEELSKVGQHIGQYEDQVCFIIRMCAIAQEFHFHAAIRPKPSIPS